LAVKNGVKFEDTTTKKIMHKLNQDIDISSIKRLPKKIRSDRLSK
jgi:hypothetical protein